MSDSNVDIDDVRYQHHLNHRGNANQRVFGIVWSCIAGFVLLRLCQRVYTWRRKRGTRANPLTSLSRNEASLLRRIASFAQAVTCLPFSPVSRTSWSFGCAIALLTYFAIILSLLLSVDAPAATPHFVDDVAFRAAWVTITQVPLVFLLSSKRGPINNIADVSYDKINCLHRWAGRMIFVSATTHVVIMKSSITTADILLSHDKGTTVVRFGIGSYFLLIWIAVTSILPLRNWSYRVFYINHWISTVAFLMMILQHVPKHATTPVYLAFVIGAVDKLLVFVSFLRNNISVRPLKPRLAKFRRAPGRAMLVAGYPVEMLEPHNLSVSTHIEEATTTIRVCNVPISWRPGQHIRLYLPALGAVEMHPFTPANCSSIVTPPPLPLRRSQDLERQGPASASTSSRQSNDVLLMIRPHTGLTRRLKEFHTEWLKLPCPNATASSTATSLTAYVDGPYGSPPVWEDFGNLVLIATSTGVSFALSIMDYLEQLCFSDASRLSTKNIHFLWIVRHIDPQFEASVADLLRRCGTMMRDSGVQIELNLHVTCSLSEVTPGVTEIDQFAHLRPRLPRYGSGDRALTIRNPDEIYDEWEEEERQWEEMEALEELQMKEADPFVDAYEVSSACSKDDDKTGAYEGDGYAASEASETSTLLNGDHNEQLGPQNHTLSGTRQTANETAAQNVAPPCSSLVRSPLLPRYKSVNEACQCALVQYQRKKLQRSARSIFNTTTYGTRPDITRIVKCAVNRNSHRRSMVAVCANGGVSRQANKAVSESKFTFARGERAADVEFFTEGFG